ncbi:aldehyde dehydrogenase family protein [Rhodococcus sp. 1168]|uniref:aldehyde dehydrogenase family protein n=1 Tax=Rhodococcus sp. 1168 TaxID=2018041 RepID=UPI000A0E07DB|nr:aldehyde dehydrogenase family protein [Rhodococcus sp. 1168]ORI25489.1 aldehyde dehydrogenase family protein [Rhodococcus sp. 1168]
MQSELNFSKHYIGGAWVTSNGADSIDVTNPATEEVIGRVPAGTASDVDAAVAAAQAALPAWSALSPSERATWLRTAHDALASRAEEIGTIISQEMGMPVKPAADWQVGLPVFNLENYAKLGETFKFEGRTIGNSLVVREPIGVVGAIAPWNYPLHQMVLKASPALISGCTFVGKPSEIAPLSTLKFAEILHEIGFPAGVFNIVCGYGVPVGEAIASHPGIDMVSFTGSTRAGTRVAELASASVKRVALELGGKSANVILDDADLELAVTDGVAKCFQNSGQTCSALTRMLVPREKLAEVEALAAKVAANFVVGDPADPSTELGPLVSAVQLDRVRRYIDQGVAEGARLVEGGSDPYEGPGYYARPTVFSDVSPAMTIAREEIFGPVLVLIGYDDEDDAVRIANDSEYGLAAGVWSADPERALAVAKRIRAGQIEVNGGTYNPAAPFGGYKKSGIGREAGEFGLEEFLEVKSIQR